MLCRLESSCVRSGVVAVGRNKSRCGNIGSRKVRTDGHTRSEGNHCLVDGLLLASGPCSSSDSVSALWQRCDRQRPLAQRSGSDAKVGSLETGPCQISSSPSDQPEGSDEKAEDRVGNCGRDRRGVRSRGCAYGTLWTWRTPSLPPWFLAMEAAATVVMFALLTVVLVILRREWRK